MSEMNIVAYVYTREGKKKEGKGFSLEELKAANLSYEKALKLGIPVDLRRNTCYEENIQTLKNLDLNNLKPKKIKKEKLGRKHRKRVFRGLTTAGKKMRGLEKEKLRNTHKKKWEK